MSNEKNGKEEYLQEGTETQKPSDEKVMRDDVKKLKPADIFKQKETDKPEIKLSDEKKYPEIAKEMSSSIRGYVNNYISLADAKAGFLLGIIMAFLAATYLNGPKVFEKPLKIWGGFEIISLVGYILLIGSIYFSVRVVWPRLSSSKKKGFVSWVHVANYSCPEEYLKDLFSAKEERIIEGIYELNYDLSNICRKKYIWLRWAFRLGLAGVLVCIFILIKFRVSA